MRWKQLTRHVWGGYVYWPLPVMVWIVEDRDGLTLVDAGIPSMWNSLYQALNVRFKNKPLVRVLLTHSHGDHVGIFAEPDSDLAGSDCSTPIRSGPDI